MKNALDDHRIEFDSLGPVSIPSSKLWGAQTQRALENFQVSDIKTSEFPVLIRAIGIVKCATAHANWRAGNLDELRHAAIRAACDEIIDNRWDDEFPLDMIQGGAGTSFNMNANEVIATLANRTLRGDGTPENVHPNDHVNMSQSTNDVYPTACRLAIVLNHQALEKQFRALMEALHAKSIEFKDVIKLGRTQLQDAVPMTLGQEFLAYATTIGEDVERGREVANLLKEVHLGGTAIGTALNASPTYRKVALEELSRLSGVGIRPSNDMIEANWDTGAFVSYSGMLKRSATKLSKMANDLRLLSSGPRGGLGEIRLPDRQPGSSIMPGKVNPVIPELMNQVCFQVIGNDLALTFAAEAGQLQLNAMEPLIVFNILMSQKLLTRATSTLTERCINGITADKDRCRQHLDRSTGLVTALVPIIGYEQAASLAKKTLESGRSLRDMLIESGLTKNEDLDTVLDPFRMI